MTINALVTNYKDSPMRLDLVRILGVNKSVTNVTIDGQAYPNYLYNFLDKVCFSFKFFQKILKDRFIIKTDFTYSWSWFGYVSEI